MAKTGESEILRLLENGKFKQVISKLKRGGLDIKKERANELLLKSHLSYADELMQNGDFLRAIREYDSAYALKNDILFLLKKSLSKLYLHHFKDVEEILKDYLQNSEALYLYLLSKIYQKKEIDKNLLKKLPNSRANYIKFLELLFDEKIDEAKDILKMIKPKLKSEKENILAIDAIINNETFMKNANNLKNFYKLLLGFSYKAYHTSSFKKIEKELKNNNNPLNKIAPLVSGKNFIKESLIDNLSIDKKSKKILYFNNAVLMLDKKNVELAYNIFKKHFKDFANYPESISFIVSLQKEIKIPFEILISFYDKLIDNFKNILKRDLVEIMSITMSIIIQIYNDRFDDFKNFLLSKEIYSFEPYLFINNSDVKDCEKMKFLQNPKEYKSALVSAFVTTYAEQFPLSKDEIVKSQIELFKCIIPVYDKIKDAYIYCLSMLCEYVVLNFDVKSEEFVYYEIVRDAIEIVLKNTQRIELSREIKIFLYSYEKKEEIRSVERDAFDILEISKELGFDEDEFLEEKMYEFDFDEVNFDLESIYNATETKKDKKKILEYLKYIKDKKIDTSVAFATNCIVLYKNIYDNLGEDEDVIGDFIKLIHYVFYEKILRDYFLKRLNDILVNYSQEEYLCSFLKNLIFNYKDYSKAWYLKIVGEAIIRCDNLNSYIKQNFLKHGKKFKSLKKLYDKISDDRQRRLF